MSGVQVEEIKTPLSYITKHQQAGDHIYIYNLAQPAWDYYQHQFSLDQLSIVKKVFPSEDWTKNFGSLKPGDRIWLLFSHYRTMDGKMMDARYLEYFKQRGQQLGQQEAPGSVCYLYEIKETN